MVSRMATPPGGDLLASVATVDITPPPGIHLHNWSYAPSPVATGVHERLESKLVALADREAGERCLLIALDLGWWMDASDEWRLRSAVLAATGLPESALILALTHTHSGPSISSADRDEPGGQHIEPYLAGITESISTAAREVLSRLEPAVLDWRLDRCTLAANRDLYLASENRFVVGYNPEAAADDTLLVGRLCREGSGETLAVITNYAVHLTSLGGHNTLLSPDLVGAARRLVENATGGTFVFLQGASGNLAPRRQYSAQTEVADRNGQVLGHAVLATLAGMDDPGTALRYSETVESGAPLGVYSAVEHRAPVRLRHSRIETDLQTQENTPLDSGTASVDRDRRVRALRVVRNVGAQVTRYALTLWELGETVIIAHPGEAYSEFQMALRAEFPERTVAVVNLANGAHQGYVAPVSAYDDGRYPAWQSPLARGCFEILLDACRAELTALVPTTAS
jgi:hypothetical protein